MNQATHPHIHICNTTPMIRAIIQHIVDFFEHKLDTDIQKAFEETHARRVASMNLGTKEESLTSVSHRNEGIEDTSK